MTIIKILTDEDVKQFNRASPKHEIVMAGFFMVNCPACEAFKPEWNKFVNSCESEGDPNVLIAEVDSNQASRVNFDTSALEGFPTVYRDVEGEEGVVEFKHERTKKALRRFLKEAMAAKGGGKKRKPKKRRKRKTKRRKRKTKRRRKSRRKKGAGESGDSPSDNTPESVATTEIPSSNSSRLQHVIRRREASMKKGKKRVSKHRNRGTIRSRRKN
jgi:hypothetical protein